MASGSLFALVIFCALFGSLLHPADAKTKKVKLHFYLHDNLSFKNPNNGTVAVVAAPKNFTSSTFFGTVFVIDDLLTAGPSPDSKEVGRAQGFYVADSLSEISFLLTFTAVFKNGTISFHGQDPILHPSREIAVIGGTGVFRFVTGYAVITTYKLDFPAAILDVHVFLKLDDD